MGWFWVAGAEVAQLVLCDAETVGLVLCRTFIIIAL